jgi:hypothetical protein
MAVTKYFRNPFATAGDRTPVPDDAQPSGAVSYADGFTSDYEKVKTDPSSKEVPRQETNEIFFDITTAIQEYQQRGIPNFITTADNDGTPYPYAKYAIVLYDDGVNGVRAFESLVDSNTALPIDVTKWKWLDGSASSIELNNSIFDVAVQNGDVVYWNTGDSKYHQAIANGSIQQNAIGIANITFNYVITAGISSLFTGLTPGNIYYLSETLAGKITNTQPDINIVEIGISKSATEIFLSKFETKIQKAIAASVYMGAVQNIPTNTNATLEFDTVEFDDYGLFDIPTNSYKLVYPGLYIVCFSCTTLPISGSGPAGVGFQLYKNNVLYARIAEIQSAEGDAAFSGPIIVKSDGTDTIHLNGSTGSWVMSFSDGSVQSSSFDIAYLGK